MTTQAEKKLSPARQKSRDQLDAMLERITEHKELTELAKQEVANLLSESEEIYGRTVPGSQARIRYERICAALRHTLEILDFA